MSGYLITGATGFVGGALTLELLRSTDAPIHVLVRGSAAAADERVWSALGTAVQRYGLDHELLVRNRDRVRVITGDLTDDDLARRLPAGDIDEVWHCAASLKFDDRSRREIFAVNVSGTARLADLAERIGVRRFNYMSTAYVTGTATGRLAESPVPHDISVNNQYERSKVAAETMLLTRAGLPTCIWRPSIVVGHSRTFAATGFTGFYGFVRGVVLLARRLQQGNGGSTRRLRFMADPTAEINLVPVDSLVRQAVWLSTQPGFDARIVHLTNRSAPTFGDIAAALALRIGIHDFEFVSSRAELGLLERGMHSAMHFFVPQGRGTKHFAQDIAERYGSPIDAPMDVHYLQAMIDWYLDHARPVGSSLAAV